MKQNNQTIFIDPQLVKDPCTILEEYTSLGGNITRFSLFGQNPLKDQPSLATKRDGIFFERYPSFEPFFHSAVNGDFSLFKEGLSFLIYVTTNLSS